jgi:hypothetical protein
MVWCSDRHKNLHAWNDEVGYKRIRKWNVKRKGRKNIEDVFRPLYPDATLDNIQWRAGVPRPRPQV